MRGYHEVEGNLDELASESFEAASFRGRKHHHTQKGKPSRLGPEDTNARNQTSEEHLS